MLVQSYWLFWSFPVMAEFLITYDFFHSQQWVEMLYKSVVKAKCWGDLSWWGSCLCLESSSLFGQSSAQPKQVPGVVWNSWAQFIYSSAQGKTGCICVAPDRRLKENRIWQILLVAEILPDFLNAWRWMRFSSQAAQCSQCFYGDFYLYGLYCDIYEQPATSRAGLSFGCDLGPEFPKGRVNSRLASPCVWSRLRSDYAGPPCE